MDRCVNSEYEALNATLAPSGPPAGLERFPRAGEETAACPRDAGSRFFTVGQLTQCDFDTSRALRRLACVGVNRHES